MLVAGWEISTTLHSYYKVLMQTDVSVNTADVAPPGPMPSGRKGQIAYEAESDQESYALTGTSNSGPAPFRCAAGILSRCSHRVAPTVPW